MDELATLTEEVSAPVVGGDFLAGVPRGGDVYVLSRVLFRCDDAEAGTLLRHVRNAMPEGGQALVYEKVIPDPAGSHPAQIDVNTFITFGGGTRTEAQLRGLAAESGFVVVAAEAAGFGLITTLTA